MNSIIVCILCGERERVKDSETGREREVKESERDRQSQRQRQRQRQIETRIRIYRRQLHEMSFSSRIRHDTSLISALPFGLPQRILSSMMQHTFHDEGQRPTMTMYEKGFPRDESLTSMRGPSINSTMKTCACLCVDACLSVSLCLFAFYGRSIWLDRRNFSVDACPLANDRDKQ